MSNIPPPPTIERAKLFLPIAFWSEIMVHLDKKIEVICKEYGFGEVEMEVKINKGRIMEVTFNDKIRVRNLVEKAGVAASSLPPSDLITPDKSDPA